jgi:hypothetical protein
MSARSHKCFWLPLFVAALAIGLLVIKVEQTRAETPLDYMTQEVCDNGSGGHTTADPVTCPAMARKLNIGESLPYHKWDTSTGQISDSYPIAELSGRLRVVQTEFFDSQSAFIPPNFDASDPATGVSGYDLVLADGSYVSAGGTYDPGAGWQPIWENSSCSLSDSWVYAPKTATVPFSYGDTTTSLNNTSPQCPPNANFGSSYTGWNYYSSLAYESGKHLNTIKTWHFGGSSINAPSIEEFFFTKEYGRTRWEAWSSQVSGPNAAAVARCPTGTNSGVATFGATTYYLTDCHDWSTVIASATGDWSPATYWYIDPLYNSTNLLKNTHMQCTNSANVSGQCNSTYTCQTIVPWGRIGDLNWGYDQNVQAPNASSNCALLFSIPDGPSGQGVYQDVTVLPAGYTNYTFGTALWSPAGANLAATVTVFEVNSAGGIVAQHNVTAAVTGRRQYFQGSFALSASTQWLRFQIYPSTTNVNYEFTESWVAPAP